MAANANLHKAKIAKNDEFYTQLTDVEKELRHYKEHFEGKVVFCNCDDPTWSAFWEYFHLNFSVLGLKKLISTHYSATERTYKLEYEGGNDNDISVGVKTDLMQNGDFRSEECIELLRESDIVVTNPPFSLFREYVAQLMEYNKKFNIVGNPNAITYKEFFPLLKDNKVWIGNKSMGTDMYFNVPDAYKKELLSTKKEGSAYRVIDGVVMGRTQAIWFTNLDIPKRHEKLILWKEYTPEEYPKYDNYDAINVDKVNEIPVDYEPCWYKCPNAATCRYAKTEGKEDGCEKARNGVMGVPITFLDKHNPEQFELVELSRYLQHDGMSKEFVDEYYRQGNKGCIHEGHPDLCYYTSEGKTIVPYMRTLVRKKGEA